jgi:hypothetical protein
MSTLKTAKVKTTTIADELDAESTAVTNVINGSAKAWVNFVGTGTVSIRRGFNVSSITDNGTGDHTINFTTAMTDANYSSLFTNGELDTSYWGPIPYIYSQATASVRVRSVFATGSFSDASSCNVIVFR